MTRVRQDRFDPKAGFDRGRGKVVEAGWYVIKMTFFLSALPWPSRWKCALLRWFGAKIGLGVVIKPRVNIHLPWKLQVGDHTWIGEEVFLLNLEPIVVGAHACISQRAFLCTGNHDFRDVTMRYRSAPIRVGDGAWVGAQAFVAPGVEIGSEAVIAAGSVVLQDMPDGMICAGHPCAPRGPRWRSN